MCKMEFPFKENFKLSRGALSTTLLITVEEFFCGCFDGCIYTKKQYIVCDVKPPCILFMVLLLLLLSAWTKRLVAVIQSNIPIRSIWIFIKPYEHTKKVFQNKRISKNCEVIHLVQKDLFHNFPIFSISFCAWFKWTPSSFRFLNTYVQ